MISILSADYGKAVDAYGRRSRRLLECSLFDGKERVGLKLENEMRIWSTNVSHQRIHCFCIRNLKRSVFYKPLRPISDGHGQKLLYFIIRRQIDRLASLMW